MAGNNKAGVLKVISMLKIELNKRNFKKKYKKVINVTQNIIASNYATFFCVSPSTILKTETTIKIPPRTATMDDPAGKS